MRTEIKTITPEMATEMLKRNKSNRNLRKFKVLQYAHDMQNGKWNLTGQGITFGKDGSLLDGQHRLQAIKFSKVSVPMLIVYDADVVGTYDCGLTRSTVDQFKLMSECNTGILYTTRGMAVVKLCYQIREFGKVEQHKNVMTTEDLKKYIDDNRTELEWAIGLVSSTSKDSIGLKKAIIGATLYSIYKLDIGFTKEDADRFARIIKTGMSDDPLKTDAPIIALRNKFTSFTRTCGSTNKEYFLRIQYAVKKYLERSDSLRNYLPDGNIFDFTKLKGEN